MKKLYLLLIVTLSASNIKILSSDQQTIAQQQLDIAKTAFATALLVTPLTGPIAQLFTTDFFEMIKALIINKLIAIKNFIAISIESKKLTQNIIDIIANEKSAFDIGSKLQQLKIDGESFNYAGMLMYNKISEAFSNAYRDQGAYLGRDFAVLSDSEKGLRYIAEESLFLYEIKAAQQAFEAMSNKERIALLTQFKALEDSSSETIEDFSDFMKDSIQEFAKDVLIDSTLAILLYNKGEEQSFDISLDELTSFIQTNKDIQSLRDKVYANIEQAYQQGRTITPTKKELSTLIQKLTGDLQLSPFVESITAPFKEYYELRYIVNQSDSFSDFEKNLTSNSTVERLGTATIGNIGLLTTGLDALLNSHVAKKLNFSLKREYQLSDPQLKNYNQLLDAVNGSGKFAGDFGIFAMFKQDILQAIDNNPTRKTQFINLLTEPTPLNHIIDFFDSILSQQQLERLAKDYISNIGLALVVLDDLRDSYKYDYNYQDIMNIVQKVKKQNPETIDRIIQNMQSALGEKATITTTAEFKEMIDALKESIEIPKTLITQTVTKVKSQVSHATDDLSDFEGIPSEDISGAEQKTVEIDATPQPAEPTDIKPVESPDKLNSSGDEGASSDDGIYHAEEY